MAKSPTRLKMQSCAVCGESLIRTPRSRLSRGSGSFSNRSAHTAAET